MDNKILVINKEKNVTSRDVVNELCQIFNTKKIGHTGTLDPIASGVLVCVIGKYTKLVDTLTALEKEYIATIKLGIETDTLDITGNILKKEEVKEIDNNTLLEVLNSFIGKYLETIPKYSAVSVNGKRLYEYAMEGKDVCLPKKEVYIKEIELLSNKDGYIKFRCLVSKGTYIRSFIKDICDKLGCLGTMSDLIRTKQGNFELKNSYTINDIKNNKYKYLKLEDILDLKIIELPDVLSKKVLNGNQLELDLNGYILFRKDNLDIALYYFEDNIGKLKILFN